ncbi:hypothetical protein PC123_g25044 [Phytophthora cactorum]|nr:hypothetical protein PC123_g25044 [Phytophthora cactorum]
MPKTRYSNTGTRSPNDQCSPQDTTRKETPFYLVHGWDGYATLKAMASSIRCGTGKQSDALAW